jgi:alpha-L-fucosidase
MNNAWGFNLKDTDYKSTRQLIQYLVQAAGHNANFLLNVGPMPNGKIQPEFQTRLQEIGQWLARYGESIYGTRGGPIAPRPWGVTTQKGTKVYVHILDWPDASLALPGQVKSAHFLKDGRRGDITEAAGGLALQIPADARDDFDTIAVLELGER